MQRRQMESELPLLARQQLFLKLARLTSEVDSTALKTYFLFVHVAGDIIATQQAFFARYEISEGKLGVLLHLREAPGYCSTPSELAQAEGVTRGTMTGLLAGLERSGLIRREPSPEDGRMFTIRLTQSAHDLFEQMLPERIRYITEFMTSLTTEEQHQLTTLLEKMYRSLLKL